MKTKQGIYLWHANMIRLYCMFDTHSHYWHCTKGRSFYLLHRNVAHHLLIHVYCIIIISCPKFPFALERQMSHPWCIIQVFVTCIMVNPWIIELTFQCRLVYIILGTEAGWERRSFMVVEQRWRSWNFRKERNQCIDVTVYVCYYINNKCIIFRLHSGELTAPQFSLLCDVQWGILTINVRTTVMCCSLAWKICSYGH